MTFTLHKQLQPSMYIGKYSTQPVCRKKRSGAIPLITLRPKSVKTLLRDAILKKKGQFIMAKASREKIAINPGELIYDTEGRQSTVTLEKAY